jgi:hypothetical protein
MSFKTKDEYEKEKYRWRNKRFQQQQPAGYEEFRSNEKAWIASQNESKSSSESKSNSSKGKSNSMQIKGNSGSSYPGETMKISREDAEFVDFGTVFSEKDITDPGTKFAKKGNFKDYLNKIKGKHFDKDGNLIVPKYEMPDRVELTKEQKKANASIDSKFDSDGYYKTDSISMPTINEYKTKKSYTNRADKLADRMGIKPANGKDILADQRRRYEKPKKKGRKGDLIIPDFSMNKQSEGRKLFRKGRKNTNLGAKAIKSDYNSKWD